MLFEHAQQVAPQEQAASRGDVVPTFAVEIINPIGESEPKAGGTMAFQMP
jgi:hypothetical protein